MQAKGAAVGEAVVPIAANDSPDSGRYATSLLTKMSTFGWLGNRRMLRKGRAEYFTGTWYIRPRRTIPALSIKLPHESLPYLGRYFSVIVVLPCVCTHDWSGSKDHLNRLSRRNENFFGIKFIVPRQCNVHHHHHREERKVRREGWRKQPGQLQLASGSLWLSCGRLGSTSHSRTSLEKDTYFYCFFTKL